jgi:hypothetical protein
MINYTERITTLMRDVVARVPQLSFIDLNEVLVFARHGRSDAEGAYATCHCLNLPTSDPGYYFWKDRKSGKLTRRSEWFVTKSPEVTIAGTPLKYLISFVLPRFCDQTLEGARKGQHYPGAEPWLAKLDTVVHELYHIDPEESGIRRVERADGTFSHRSHGPEFYKSVADMVHQYLATNPDPALFDFLRHDFVSLDREYGGVRATTFRNYPSFPQRYIEALDPQPVEPLIRVVPLKRLTQPTHYTDAALHVRQFFVRTSPRVAAQLPDADRAA